MAEQPEGGRRRKRLPKPRGPAGDAAMDRDAAPARDGSQPSFPGGTGDPPGDTTISCDGFADG